MLAFVVCCAAALSAFFISHNLPWRHVVTPLDFIAIVYISMPITEHSRIIRLLNALHYSQGSLIRNWTVKKI